MQLPTWLVALLGALLAFGVIGWILLLRRGSVRTVASIAQPPELPAKIEAIKRYREEHGVGLKEAKEAVEAQLRGEQTAPPIRTALGRESVEDLVRAGNLIGAIKLYHEQTGVSLREAKDAVERMRDAM